MYKASKTQVLGLAMVMMLVVGDLYAKTIPDCEIGDAVFRYKQYEDILGVGFHHAGIYFCSHSKGDEVYVETTPPYYINITDSDLQHSVIEAVGYGGVLSCQPFIKSYIKSPGGYKGGYNSGTLDAEMRRHIIAAAWGQKGKVYATGDPKRQINERPEKPEDIKNIGKSFRCDGLVEYCYEVIKYKGVDSSGNSCDNYGFFSSWEEKNCWPSGITGVIEAVWAAFFDKKDAFYPKALMARMQKAKAYLPQVKSLKVYKEDGTEVGEYDWIEANKKYIVKINVTDESKEGLHDGSGIDKVELYYRIRLLKEEGKIEKEDKDEDTGKIYEFEWIPSITTIGNNLYELFVQVYDRAGNKTLVDNSKFVYGSPYNAKDPLPIIIDNKAPEVANTSPANGNTKISLGKKIRITFSEEMGTKTINDNTILVNNGAIVGSVTYNEDLRTAFFVPDKPLEINTNYAVLVKSGDTGVKDKAGNPMASDYTFSFTTTNDLVSGKVIEVPVTYTDEYGKEHPVPAGTQFMSSYWLRSSGKETYIVSPGTWRWVEEDGKVRFNWPGGNLNEQKFRVFFESKSYSLIKGSPNFWVLTDKYTNSITHSFASELFEIDKPEGSDVYVPVDGTITIYHKGTVTIPHWSKVYYNRTGALHSLGVFNKGFDYIVTHDGGINPVDYASWMENRDFTLAGITCYGTNSPNVDKLSAWRILVNGIKKDEWSEDKLLASFGNLLIKRYGENYMDYKLLLSPKFNRRTDVFQAWVNGFSHYYSCITRGTATIEVRDVDTQLTNTYNLDSLGSETQGLDNEAAVAAALWKMKDPYNVWKATRKYDNIITPPHKGFNVQDFWRELGTQSYIPMPQQTWLEHGLMPKIKYATATNTPNPQLFWDRNGILDKSIGVSWRLEVATESTFTEPILFVKTQIGQENYHLTDINLEDGIYYWRVRVEDEYLPGNLQNALPRLYSPNCSFEIRLPKQAGITVISDPTTQGIPSDVIVSIYDKEGSVYTGAYWVEQNQMNRTNTLDLRYTPITVHFEAQGGNAVVPPDYTFEEGSCVHIFENGVIFNEPGTYSVTISLSGEGINIPAVSHTGIKVVPKGITPHHFHVVDILDPIDEGGTSNVSLVVHDVNENLVIGYTGSVYFTSTDPQADLPQTYTFTAGDYGVKTFVDGVVLNTPGSQTVFAIDVNNPQIMGSQTVDVIGTLTIEPEISISPTSGQVGTVVTVMGEGFGQTETVVIDFGITKSITTTTTNEAGSFSVTFRVDTQPYGITSIVATGLNSQKDASGTFTIYSNIILVSPTEGTVGTIVTVVGNGYGAVEKVMIVFGIYVSITEGITSNDGRFFVTFTVDTQSYGTTTISAYGVTSGGIAYNTFFIHANIIFVTPVYGTIGSSVTLAGNGFGANERIRIDFGTTKTMMLTTTDGNGKFISTFTVDSQPYGLTSITAGGLLSNTRAYAIFNIKSDFVIIRGKIVDSMSNHPIRGAVIEIIQNKRVKGTATTDNKGNYRIENIPAGIYQIRAKKEIVHRWRKITWRRLVYIPHTKYQVELNTVDNEVNFYLAKAYWVERAHIVEGNEINTNEKKNMDVRIKVNYNSKYWFYLYPKDASSYEIKEFGTKSIGLNGCWSRKGKWYNIDWDDGTYIDKANNRLHVKVRTYGYWWRRAYFNYRYTIDCQLKGSSNKDKNSPIVVFEPEKEKTPKIGMVKLAINRIKLEQQGANPLQEEKNVLSVMVKDVEDTLTTAKITLKFNPDKVKIEDIKSPVLPDAGLKVFVEGKIDNDKGSVQVEALVVDEDLLIGTYTDIVDKTTLLTSQQVDTNRDTPDIHEENIAPIAQIIIEPKEIKGAAKRLNLDDMLSYVEIEGIELRNAQGEEIPINVEDKPTQPTYAQDLKFAYCYPNPTNKGEITFAKLTKRVKVRIFNIAGELVYGEEEPPVESNGTWQWRCINNAGEKVASGIYIYILKDPLSGSIKKGKLGIIR